MAFFAFFSYLKRHSKKRIIINNNKINNHGLVAWHRWHVQSVCMARSPWQHPVRMADIMLWPSAPCVLTEHHASCSIQSEADGTPKSCSSRQPTSAIDKEQVTESPPSVCDMAPAATAMKSLDCLCVYFLYGVSRQSTTLFSCIRAAVIRTLYRLALIKI